jgi:hypothetical protein
MHFALEHRSTNGPAADPGVLKQLNKAACCREEQR